MSAPDLEQPRRHLTLLDAACVIVGIIIGSGIYETTPLIARSAGHPLPLAIIWFAGGLIALAGALCYAELATAFPHAGGDYLFLRRAYGPTTGFLFGWFDLWIMRPANIGAMAVVFSRYFHQLFPGGYATPPLHYALGVVLVLWSFTLLGARPGAWLQNTLTLAKCAGLLCVATAGFYCALWLPAPAATAADAPVLQWSWEGPSLAFVLVMFSYGGWNDVSFLAGEIKEPRKNMFRSLVLGVGCVAVIYLTVNYAFYAALGWQGLTTSAGGAAADVARRAGGQWGARAVSVLICVSCAGAISGMMYAASRMYFALGRHHSTFGWLGQWNHRTHSPLRAQLVQGAVVMGMLAWSWSVSRDPFTNLVVIGAPFFWIFLTLSGLSLIRLRYSAPEHPRTYFVPFYPTTPLLFASACLFMLYSSGAYLWRTRLFVMDDQGRFQGFNGAAYWALAVLLSGLACGLAGRRRTAESKPGASI